MAGGLFNVPFQLNIKCIIFALIIMSLFLYKPVINNMYILGIVLFIIFVISYVAMAWYDYYYKCINLPLKKSKVGITDIFKPHQYLQEQTNNSNKKKGHLIIYLSHILFIVPLLIYIGYYKKKVNTFIYPILIVLAVFTLLYHGGAIIQGSHNL